MLKLRRINITLLIMHVRCINTGESAAVFGFPLRIKVVEFLLPGTAAAGSLGGWMSEVSGVSWEYQKMRIQKTEDRRQLTARRREIALLRTECYPMP